MTCISSTNDHAFSLTIWHDTRKNSSPGDTWRCMLEVALMMMHEGVFKNTSLVVQLESWNMEHKEQITVSGTAKLENIDKMLSCWKRLKAKFPKLSQFRLIHSLFEI